MKLTITIKDCKNWRKIWDIRGENCYNCAKRDGYPYYAQPDKNCKNFKLKTKK